MKNPMRRSMEVAALVLVACATTLRADLAVYNQSNPPDTTDLPSGGWGTYRGFSFTMTDTALSLDATGAHAGTTLGDYLTVSLTGLLLRHSGTQGASPSLPTGDWSNALVKVYSTQTPTTGSYVGDSENTQDMSYGGSERNVSYTFDNLSLTPGTKYYFYFSNTAGNIDPALQTWTSGRLRVSNNANVTYGSGNLINPTWGNQDTAYDAVFVATSVPEPATAGLFALLGGALLLRRRRR